MKFIALIVFGLLVSSCSVADQKILSECQSAARRAFVTVSQSIFDKAKMGDISPIIFDRKIYGIEFKNDRPMLRRMACVEKRSGDYMIVPSTMAQSFLGVRVDDLFSWAPIEY